MTPPGKLERVARCAMYAGLLVLGLAGLAYPSELVQDAVAAHMVYFWTTAMALSAILALWGSAHDLWIGEYVALPLMIAVLVLYGIVTLDAANEGNPARWAYGFLILTYSSGLFARWCYVNGVRRANLEGLKNEQREG